MPPTSDISKKKTKTKSGNGVAHTDAALDSEPKQALVKQKPAESTTSYWWPVFIIILSLTFATRLHKVTEPDHVCWDETHFGKMGSWYINRTFFFDVHPPLGKMLVGLFGKLTGYNGSFPFNKPGDKYEDVPYVGMRVCCVAMGAMLVPFAFLTVWELTKSVTAAALSACLILFDNGIITLTQYILLDPILLCFIMGSVYGSVKFQSLNRSSDTQGPFTFSWWLWLTITGVFLACSLSVKFVGLFVVIFVGLQTISDLWDIWGDLKYSVVYIGKHFLARAVCLILIPALLYISFFYIHLKILNRSGTGDGFFSSAFQSQLQGNSLYNASLPREVAYGAVITLKSQRTGGGYLHSHWHLYPENVGARQQQVTTYSHKDENNKWIVKKYDTNELSDDPSKPIELLRHGDLVRLEHVPTKRNLHSHKEMAPVTKRHFQVTCYGENGTGDANDVWKVELVGGQDGDLVQTVTSQVKLVHFLTGCALHTHSKQLPKWAYEQMEVSCNPNLRDPNNLWNVEDNFFPRLPNVSFEVYAPSFWSRFMESHAVMLQGNAGLKPKEGEVTSKPWQWPINYRGQFFSGNTYRIYLLGNPIIWWGNLVLLGVFLVTYFIICVRRQRGIEDSPDVKELEDTLIRSGNWMLIGWLLHYVPFWGMGRILYFHHYFPALLFSSMLSGIILDYILHVVKYRLPSSVSETMYHWLMGVIVSVVVYSFYLFAPLTYGMHGPSAIDPNSTMHNLKWLESWEF